MAGSNKHGHAWAISDRSGQYFNMRDMVIEPGTGWLVHKSENDGKYSLVDHPANRIAELTKFMLTDPVPVENARPDIDRSEDLILRDEDGNPVLDERGNVIYSFLLGE